MKRRAEWQLKSDKEENEFGNKPRNDPSTLERFESKKKIIEFRQLKEEPIISDLMKD
jgi:hypothetical protein